MAYTDYFDEVQSIYIAYYQRPADPAGLRYWAQRLNAEGGNLDAIIDAFSNSPEAKSLYTETDPLKLVDSVYQALFGRPADNGADNFYVKALEAGKFPDGRPATLGRVAIDVLNGAQGDDRVAIDNKLKVANDFTQIVDGRPLTDPEFGFDGLAVTYKGDADAAAAREFLKGVTSDPSTVPTQDGVKEVVAEKIADPTDAPVETGKTFMLTQGLDTIVGTSGNDTINAFAFNSVTGADVTTLNSVDTIDGGAGTDTLNIEVKDDGTGSDYNNAIQGTISNVEIININNTAALSAGAIDATTLGAAAQQIWQIGKEAAVTKLAATTTAGFKNLATAETLDVTPADTAATATVAFDNIAEASTLNFNATGTGILNSVTISGSVKDTDADGTVGATAVSVTVGKDVESLSVNSAVKTTLTVVDGAGTKKVSTVNASASTGDIAYNAGVTVANVTTGAGKDTVTNNFIFTSTVKAASVSTGAGDDTLNVLVDNNTNAINATVTVDAGAGDDTIVLNADRDATATLGVTLTAGAGNDKVTLSDGIDSVATTDVIDGGEGTDTVVIAGKTLDAEDYIILRDVVKNFEAIDFTTSSATVDASRMSAYKSFSFADAAGTITKVAADQALTTTIGLTATAAGYVLDSDLVTAGNQTTYAGTLNITAKEGVTVTANAETVNLTVTPVTNKDGTVDNTSVTLIGDAKVANVTLNATTDNNNTTTTAADDVLETSTLVLSNAAANAALTTLTISGNGSATVTNADGKALTSIDASGLNSVDIAGAIATGLTYTTTNTAAETVKLGGGLDSVDITGSTVLKSDTITGLTLVDDAAVAGTQVDATKSDVIAVNSNDGTNLTTFVKTTTTAATLDLALVDLAGSASGDKLVFQFGGDTYIYADVAADGTAGDNIVNDTDVLVKLTGLVDLDLLVSALG